MILCVRNLSGAWLGKSSGIHLAASLFWKVQDGFAHISGTLIGAAGRLCSLRLFSFSMYLQGLPHSLFGKREEEPKLKPKWINPETSPIYLQPNTLL